MRDPMGLIILFYVVYCIFVCFSLIPGEKVVTTPLWPGQCDPKDHSFNALEQWKDACPPSTSFSFAVGKNIKVPRDTGIIVDGCLWKIYCSN